MRKFLWFLYQPYKYLVFFPATVVLNVFFGAVSMLAGILIGPKAAGYLGGVWWARMLLAFTPAWVKVRGRENIEKKNRQQ